MFPHSSSKNTKVKLLENLALYIWYAFIHCCNCVGVQLCMDAYVYMHIWLCECMGVIANCMGISGSVCVNNSAHGCENKTI